MASVHGLGRLVVREEAQCQDFITKHISGSVIVQSCDGEFLGNQEDGEAGGDSTQLLNRSLELGGKESQLICTCNTVAYVTKLAMRPLDLTWLG